MTTQYHEGQEVEVVWPVAKLPHIAQSNNRVILRKAKIIAILAMPRVKSEARTQYEVEFTDSTRRVIDTDHIRT